MSVYLPLCAMRIDQLPVACRTCAWWLTSGGAPAGRETSHALRRDWMVSLEPAWGSTGLIHLLEPTSRREPSPGAAGSIHYAPAGRVPRLRELPLGPLPPESALLFCLRTEGSHTRPVARRILQKALAQLRFHEFGEAYAFASRTGGSDAGERCEFFALDLLETCGFKSVRDNGDLYLMRVDLGGLASVLSRLESAVRRAFGGDPAPSPAAWTHHG